VTTELREQLQATLGQGYTLERELAGGGMSRVFVAEERALGRRVVVKILPPDMARDVSLERFHREIHLAAGLLHPHIIPLLSAGDADGLPYYTMPFIVGESLRLRLARDGRLGLEDAVRLAREVAMALDYAHRQGIVHRRHQAREYPAARRPRARHRFRYCACNHEVDPGVDAHYRWCRARHPAVYESRAGRS